MGPIVWQHSGLDAHEKVLDADAQVRTPAWHRLVCYIYSLCYHSLLPYKCSHCRVPTQTESA